MADRVASNHIKAFRGAQLTAALDLTYAKAKIVAQQLRDKQDEKSKVADAEWFDLLSCALSGYFKSKYCAIPSKVDLMFASLFVVWPFSCLCHSTMDAHEDTLNLRYLWITLNGDSLPVARCVLLCETVIYVVCPCSGLTTISFSRVVVRSVRTFEMKARNWRTRKFTKLGSLRCIIIHKLLF